MLQKPCNEVEKAEFAKDITGWELVWKPAPKGGGKNARHGKWERDRAGRERGRRYGEATWFEEATPKVFQPIIMWPWALQLSSHLPKALLAKKRNMWLVVAAELRNWIIPRAQIARIYYLGW